jgi:hypothetical protein
MKLCIAVAAALIVSSTLAAQDKPKTRVIVEDGKEMTLTGCVQRNPDGNLTLTNAAGKDGDATSYILTALNTDDNERLDDLKDHVGHRVEIKGRAADRGDGKIRVRTENSKTETKSEVKGDLSGLPFLGVKSFRMMASVCP